MAKLPRFGVMGVGLLMMDVLVACVASAEPEIGVMGAPLTGSGGDGDLNVGPGYDEELNGRSLVGSAFEAPAFLPSGATQYFSVGTIGVRGGRIQYVALSG